MFRTPIYEVSEYDLERGVWILFSYVDMKNKLSSISILMTILFHYLMYMPLMCISLKICHPVNHESTPSTIPLYHNPLCCCSNF